MERSSNGNAGKLDLGNKPEATAVPSGWEYLTDRGMIRCAFSSGGKLSGTTFWFIEQVAPEKFEAYRLNPKHVPSGDPEYIPMHRLVNEFTPQLAYYEDEVIPAMKTLEETLEQGDELREQGRLYSAEMEYGSALEIDEKNVRALFGLGLIFTTRKELGRTRELLDELINVKATFAGKNQFLFNEFGISLRKVGLFREAISYYSRALEFVKDDEHLYYNLARSHYENNDWNACMEALVKSQMINPDLEVGRELLRLIIGLASNDELLSKYDKIPVPPRVAEKAKRILSNRMPKVSLDEAPISTGDVKRARYGGEKDD